jgi:mannose-6-phosphate isomerase-like protein (cupin superfamily)
MNKVKMLQPEIHSKGWGKEEWIINCQDYCMKFLDFKAGTKGSMHFHVRKHETWYIAYGKLSLSTINTENASQTQLILTQGDIVDIPRLNPHQVEALEDTRIIEVSTQHFEEDSYRVSPGSSQNKT